MYDVVALKYGPMIVSVILSEKPVQTAQFELKQLMRAFQFSECARIESK